ncbi:hypothetical protein BCR36DRAFT_274804 [Piromyces finnis]|uniref:Uncharacterized protein n=1 Tax=Piromyces finnis TaxID=1754191 RepID=A0A1Y1VMP8_9FUNG|nr:hypothetical protein BCR36DRAFT_274804 [Piromyces finnis]|eukprot:ORX60196.1 hypothetical protein BCR36DRAFT_274804 [Piromyces finnis]
MIDENITFEISPINVITYQFNNKNNEWIPVNNIKKITTFYFQVLLPKNIQENEINNKPYKIKTINNEKIIMEQLEKEIENKKKEIFPYPVIIMANKLVDTTMIIIEKFFPSKIFIEKGNDYFCILRTEYLLPIVGFQFTSSILLDRFKTQFEKCLFMINRINENQGFLSSSNLLPETNQSQPPLLNDININKSDVENKIKLTLIKNYCYNDMKIQMYSEKQKEKSIYHYPSYYGTIITSSINLIHMNLILYIEMIFKNYCYYKNLSTSIFPLNQIFLASKIIYDNKEWTGLPLFEKNKLFLEVSSLDSIHIQKYLQPFKLLNKYTTIYCHHNQLSNLIKSSLKDLTSKLYARINQLEYTLRKQLWVFHHEVFHFIMYGIKDSDIKVTSENYLELLSKNKQKYSDLWKEASSCIVYQSHLNSSNHSKITDNKLDNSIHTCFHFISDFYDFQKQWYSILPKNFKYHQDCINSTNKIKNHLFNTSSSLPSGNMH